MIKEFSDILIDPKSRLKAAMNQLNATSKKILFVVDKNRKMIGSLSDGDIRRWILSGGSLEAEIQKVCFRNTYFASPGYNVDEVKSQMTMKKIDIVPVLDSKRRIIQILTFQKLFNSTLKPEKKTPIRLPVVIMAGGKGTRLDPFTKILPKPLIPIGDKSIIEIIIGKFVEYDVDSFYISLNHKSKIIKSYFEELSPSYRIKYLYEDKPLGTAGCLKQLENCFSGSFIMTNCDIIIEADYNEVLNHHEKEDNDITLVASLKHFNIPY
ncbi:MAG: sugar phosphate nucleotidyltransferase, partial [Victivallales bacterium]